MNDAETYYGFTCEINSVQMADKITAELHYKENDNNKTISCNYTAKDYLNMGFANEEEQKTLALLKAIADYGHYAQPPLARENKWTVGIQHAVMTSQTSETDFDEYVKALTDSQDLHAYALEKGSDTSGIVVKYSLNLKSETQINVYFETPEGMSLKAHVDNEGDSQVIENGRYKINIAGISAHKLGDTYTITVQPYAGQTQYLEFTVKVSAMSYVNTVLGTQKPEEGSDEAVIAKDTEMRRLVASLYKYFKATIAYMNK